MSKKDGKDPRGICPRCEGRRMNPHQKRNALSRKDNKTHICSSCSVDEAMRDLYQKDTWPGFPAPFAPEGLKN